MTKSLLSLTEIINTGSEPDIILEALANIPPIILKERVIYQMINKNEIKEITGNLYRAILKSMHYLEGREELKNNIIRTLYFLIVYLAYGFPCDATICRDKILFYVKYKPEIVKLFTIIRNEKNSHGDTQFDFELILFYLLNENYDLIQHETNLVLLLKQINCKYLTKKTFRHFRLGIMDERYYFMHALS